MVPVRLASLIPARTRVARPASRAVNTAKTAAQIVVMWSVLLAAVPLALARAEEIWGLARLPPRPLLGAGLFGAMSLLGILTANVLVRDGRGTPLPFDTARELVASGPYRYVRNPMAMFGFGQGLAVGLWLGSPAVLVYTVVGIATWQWLARPWEEADLQARFGEAYRRYKAAVPCWIPRLKPYRAPADGPSAPAGASDG
jgi:protein-S-isoprenylcysteine O-methyltransferase Ste14